MPKPIKLEKDGEATKLVQKGYEEYKKYIETINMMKEINSKISNYYIEEIISLTNEIAELKRQIFYLEIKLKEDCKNR